MKNEIADLLREIRITAGDDVKSKLEKYSRINNCVSSNLPKSLFRYRRTSEPHNIDALRNDVIPVSKPSVMGDIFDSLIPINAEKAVERIKQLQGGIDGIAEYFSKGGKIPEWVLQSLSRKMRRTIECNQHRLKDSQVKAFMKNATPKIEEILLTKVREKANQPIEILKSTGYIACLCEQGDNLKMWSDYADKHTGYVLEYDMETLNPRFHTFDAANEQFQPEDIVLPVIYGEQYDSTDFVINRVLNELLREVATNDIFIRQQDELWHIKGYLYKHGDYESEAEWRLITPIKGVSADATLHTNVKGKPKAIYYGAKMPDAIIKELDEIAQDRQIMRYRMEMKTPNIGVVAVPI